MSFSSIEASLREGLTDHQAGRLDQAERIYRDILAKDQGNAWAWYLLGALMNQRGNAQSGVEMITRALQLGLRGPEMFNHLGECYRGLDRYEEAIEAYQSALRMNPQQGEAMANLGSVLNTLSRFTESLPILERAVSIRPDLAEAHYNYGLALDFVGRLDEAIAQWEMTLRLNPDHPAAMNHLGLRLQQLGQSDRAIEVLSNLVRQHPTYAEGYSNYGIALCLLGEHDQAVEMARQAIELAPNQPGAFAALAMVCVIAARYDDALIEIRKAVELIPTDSKMRVTLATILLHLGQYIEGFQQFEYRDDFGEFIALLRHANKEIWDGRTLTGKTILLHGEQGFGDIIQFARYIPLLIETGARVDVIVWKEIATLLKSIQGISEIVSPDNANIDKYEFHFPLLSLARHFKTTLETIPANVPYLKADTSYVARWKPIVDAHARGLKVGIVWGGNPIPDPYRSCSIKYVSMLADVPNVSWYSLQVGEHREALRSAPAEMNILDIGQGFGNFAETATLVSQGKLPGPIPLNRDFADTAAAMSLMDLIITIDTSAAHLAGALGLKAWVMLPLIPDWRWMRHGNSTPWYPTLKLFRQRKLNDWGPVIEQIRQELMQLVKLGQ